MKRARCRLILMAALCVGIGCWSAAAQQPDNSDASGIAFRRAATLTHGVNLSGWFGGWGDYSVSHTSTYITERDFELMHSMGVRFVRFPVDPVLLTRGGASAADKAAVWKRVDEAIDMAMNAGLAVDFVVFPKDDYKQRLTTQAGVDQFVLLWRELARHFVDRDPNRFFFELMNESEEPDAYRWIGVESAVVRAIRTVDSRHTILASGAHYDSLDDLLMTEAINDPNIIYTFHFYEPYQFTHQGASWGSSEWNYFRDIPYPASSSAIDQRMKEIPNDYARYQLYQYGAGNWNAATISQRVAFAAEWGRERNVPVICNEFGAFRDTAPPDSRARYLHDVRTALEQNGIGWAVWDWSGNFGIVVRQGVTVVPDPADVDALGLKQP